MLDPTIAYEGSVPGAPGGGAWQVRLTNGLTFSAYLPGTKIDAQWAVVLSAEGSCREYQANAPTLPAAVDAVVRLAGLDFRYGHVLAALTTALA